MSSQISIIATVNSETILRFLRCRLVHFSLSFLEEHIVDSVLSDAVDEALEEATLEVLIIRFLLQEAVSEKGLKAFFKIFFIFFLLLIGISSSEAFWNLRLEALPSRILRTSSNILEFFA